MVVFIPWLLSFILFQIKILKKYPNETQIKVRVKYRLCVSGSEGEISHRDVDVFTKTSITMFQANGMLKRSAYVSQEEMHC